MTSVLIDVLPAELPGQYQNILDSDRPLPAQTVFIPTGLTGWLAPIFLLVFVGPFTVGTAITVPEVWLASLQNIPTDPRSLYVDPFVLLATVPVTGWAAWRLWQAWQQRRLCKAGRWREGLFLFPEALLLNNGHQCTLIARESIVKAPAQETGPNTGLATLPTVMCRDEAGNIHTVELPYAKRILIELKNWTKTRDLQQA